jgi:hypothetical protein
MACAADFSSFLRATYLVKVIVAGQSDFDRSTCEVKRGGI